MLEKVLEIIKKEELMGAGELVVAGVSGGADSICLLSVLFELKEKLGIRLGAVHVHHGIRGMEADRDAEFVRRFCEERQIPCKIYYRNIPKMAKEQGMSEEEAGRYARYACFREALAEWHGDKVAVAHNRNDNAETVLFHLFRGSGLKGLSGMEPLSRLPGDGEDGRRILVRPLLFVSRGEIEDYLRKRSVSFCQDSTNGSEAYSRNRIRRRILPQAELVNKEAVSHIVQAASMIGEIDEWLEKEAFRWINMYCHHGKNGVSIPCIQFEELAREQKGRILRMVIGQLLGSLKDITKRHTDSVLELSAKQSGRSFDLPGGLKAERGYEKLWIGFKEKEQQEKGIVILEPSEEEKAAGLFGYCFRYQRKCRDENEKIPENRYTKWFDYDKIKDSLCLRGRRPGDYFQAFSDGRSQTVKSYMINEKIPTEDRDRIPLLADGSHILWIISGRISEAYKVTEDTSRILVVEVLPECKITD